MQKVNEYKFLGFREDQAVETHVEVGKAFEMDEGIVELGDLVVLQVKGCQRGHGPEGGQLLDPVGTQSHLHQAWHPRERVGLNARDEVAVQDEQTQVLHACGVDEDKSVRYTGRQTFHLP